uniref:Proline dehydrogenase n=1 Tax=Lygus hesperus TaxID=30085 RepID=A0A0A9WL92_LYGHE
MNIASKVIYRAVQQKNPLKFLSQSRFLGDKSGSKPSEPLKEVSDCIPATLMVSTEKDKPIGSSIKLKKTLDTSFNNAEEAFRSKTTGEVFRAYLVYLMSTSSFLVDNNMALMKIGKGILGERLFTWVMKKSFYGHFVAGEDRHKIVPTLKRMQDFGVRSILDYSVEEDLSHDEAEKRELVSSTSEVKQVLEGKEKVLVGGEMPQYTPSKEFADRRYKVSSARTYFYVDEKSCEQNLQIFKDCLETSAKYTNGSAFTAIKMTALGRPQLLLQISEVIMRARKFVSEVVGGRGNVLGQHLTAEELTKRLEQAGVKDTKKFLEKVTTDREGVIHLFPWTGIIDMNLGLNDSFHVPSLKEGKW